MSKYNRADYLILRDNILQKLARSGTNRNNALCEYFDNYLDGVDDKNPLQTELYTKLGSANELMNFLESKRIWNNDNYMKMLKRAYKSIP